MEIQVCAPRGASETPRRGPYASWMVRAGVLVEFCDQQHCPDPHLTAHASPRPLRAGEGCPGAPLRLLCMYREMLVFLWEILKFQDFKIFCSSCNSTTTRLNARNGCFIDQCMVPIDQTDAIDVLYRLEVVTHDGVWADFAVLAPLPVRRSAAGVGPPGADFHEIPRFQNFL